MFTLCFTIILYCWCWRDNRSTQSVKRGINQKDYDVESSIETWNTWHTIKSSVFKSKLKWPACRGVEAFSSHDFFSLCLFLIICPPFVVILFLLLQKKEKKKTYKAVLFIYRGHFLFLQKLIVHVYHNRENKILHRIKDHGAENQHSCNCENIHHNSAIFAWSKS